jgi:DNA-binding response OmpR family regulator
MLSADATPSQPSRFRRAGADAYLTKPIHVRELLSAIDDALSR